MIEIVDRKGHLNIFHPDDIVKVFREKSDCVKICLVGKIFVRTEEGYPLKTILDAVDLKPIKNGDRIIEYISNKAITLINAVERGTRVNYIDGQYTFTFENIESLRDRFDQDI